MSGEISRYEVQRRSAINEVARLAAEESLSQHLAVERANKQAEQLALEQELHGRLTKTVVEDAVGTVSSARDLAGDDEMLKAVAGQLVQSYLNRSQQRLESFGL